jgi:hypothetical protein
MITADKYAAQMATQWLKIVNDCANLVNTTKKPDVFFKRYSLLYEKLNDLIKIERYVKFTGDKPSKILYDINYRRPKTINDFILRYYNDVRNSISGLKTQNAKINKAEQFYTKLMHYSNSMGPDNIVQLTDLYEKLKAI